MSHHPDHLKQPALSVARSDFTTLRDDLTIRDALNAIRERGIGEKIVYFYVINASDQLVGVLPTRRLLTASPDRPLCDLMIRNIVTIPHTATILDACETFILYKFLAIPIVDEQQRIVGLVDVGLLTQEAFDMAERDQTDALFESIGFRVSQVRGASPIQAFRYRFPWLLTTILSGTLCAILASVFELTLAKSLILAFFMTLVLGLGESVSIQSMTVAIQALRATKPDFQWYFHALRREAGTAALLGAACGALVGLIVWLWRGAGLEAVTIGCSIFLSLAAACFFGLSIPSFLHALRLDPKIAAGPVTLACTDIFTLLFYFSIAALVL